MQEPEATGGAESSPQPTASKKMGMLPGVVAYACNPSALEAEAGGSPE